jgi:nicotinate-nucleotide pyrophosphorylase (carboxylating)
MIDPIDRPVFPPASHFEPLIRLAMAEDLGPANDDVTSRLSIGPAVQGVGTLVLKQPGVVCGLPIIPHVCRAYDPSLIVEPVEGIADGHVGRGEGEAIARIRGPLRSLLSAERVVLNFVQHLSGVATRARQFSALVEGTAAKIIDTRKTMPGFRMLDKYAVVCGGGANHRTGLYDMVLLKDNHLAAMPQKELAAALRAVVRSSRAENASRPIEVEVDTLDQLRDVLTVDGIDFILLDNMPPDVLATAVAMRDAAGRSGKTLLEASGGVSEATVAAIARSGVERISIGAITHSAPASDIGLDVQIA